MKERIMLEGRKKCYDDLNDNKKLFCFFGGWKIALYREQI